MILGSMILVRDDIYNPEMYSIGTQWEIYHTETDNLKKIKRILLSKSSTSISLWPF